MQLGDIASLALAALSLAAAVHYGRVPIRQGRERASIERFLSERRRLKGNGVDVKMAAARYHQKFMPDPALPVLADSNWLLESPRLINCLRFELVSQATPIPEAYLRGRKLLPLDASGNRYISYHDAVDKFDRPANWFDATTYETLSIEVDPEQIKMQITPSRYMAGFDKVMFLAHEAVDVYLRTKGRRIDGPIRRNLSSPLDLWSLPRPTGFSVLTVRKSVNGSTFYLHRRDESVAIGQNKTSVIPAGEFQPSDDSRYALAGDLDIWKAIMREYAEEFLGMEEARFRQGAPIDYEADSPYTDMSMGLSAGTIRPYLLSLGIDPLDWKLTIRAICIFDAEIFDRIFSEMRSINAEGMLELPTLRPANSGGRQGWPFTEEIVMSYVGENSESFTDLIPLAQAWKHRKMLGISDG